MNNYYNDNTFLPTESEIKNTLKDLEEKILEEQESEQPNQKKITNLMMQQLLKGLYLQTIY